MILILKITLFLKIVNNYSSFRAYSNLNPLKSCFHSSDEHS
jgi:hypothetical protein